VALESRPDRARPSGPASRPRSASSCGRCPSTWPSRSTTGVLSCSTSWQASRWRPMASERTCAAPSTDARTLFARLASTARPARLTKLREVERHALGQRFAARSGQSFLVEPPPNFQGRVELGDRGADGTPTPSSPTGRGSPGPGHPRPPRARRTGCVAQAGSRWPTACARSRQRPRSLTARGAMHVHIARNHRRRRSESARACTDRTNAAPGHFVG